MSRTIKGPFATQAEADAFVEGVEYVNDGDYLTVKSVVVRASETIKSDDGYPRKSWFVNLEDQDRDGDDRLEQHAGVWLVVSE